ncbi:MAG TPA: hypothetical protein VF017_17890 [Thermoanaerobaculia bacterium]|nr:hypothetical protein [Thermoanaerobaculia bacterium]
MAATLTFLDATTTGERRAALRVNLEVPTITVRELIRTRVFEEVTRYNRDGRGPYQGLVEPTDLERDLNPVRRLKRRSLDWHEQVEVALAAFESSGFLLLVDDRQVTSLDEQVAVKPGTEVTFLKLVPLVGG